MSPRRRRYVDPADDPVPADLTDEEKDAVRRQGETLADRRAEGVPLLGDPGYRRRGDATGYDFGD